MLDETLRHDLRHDLVGVVDALAALKAQGEAWGLETAPIPANSYRTVRMDGAAL